jgi:hypothetical protein
MTRTLRIFRKDARRLWPAALVYVAVTALAATRWPWSQDSLWRSLPLLLAPLACWVLAVTLIHEERLIGDEQYWLTRPYSWKDLVAAKALFLVVFVNLPLLICQVAAVAAAGLSPWEWLPALLWRQVFFSIFFIMPAVALAAVTRNLGQVVLTGVVIGVILITAGPALSGSHYPDWGGFDWIRNCGAALVMAAGTAAAVVLQYTRRRTALARGIVAGTLALAAVTAYAPVWGGAFAIQKLFFQAAGDWKTGRPGGLPHVSFDESRAGAHPMRYGRSSNDPDGVRLEIPLRVDNVPPGARLAADWTSAGIEGPNGVWRSGWLKFNAFHGLSHGEAWLTVYVDPEFYEKNQDAAVRLSGKVDFMVYQLVRTMTAPEDAWAAVPGVGLCMFAPTEASSWVSSAGQTKEVRVPQTGAVCYSPFQRLAVIIPDPDDEALHGAPNAPFPTSASFQALDWTGAWKMSAHTLSLALYRPVACAQPGFEARGLHMRDFHLKQ